MKKSIALLLALFASSVATAQQNITSPEVAFGFKPGTDRKLADWNELIAYFKKLSAESDSIRYQELGKTTEGRPFIAVTISSADNLAHLRRYKEIQRKLVDSWRRLVARWQEPGHCSADLGMEPYLSDS
jgi:hypothetical protein